MTTQHVALGLTDAVVAVLEADGTVVGDSVVPVDGSWQGIPGESVFTPYIIVYPLPGGGTSGTIRNPDEDSQAVYQLSCVGATRRQAEWLADHARNVLLAPAVLTVSGRRVLLIEFDGFSGTLREDVVGQPSIFQTVDRYRILTGPS